MAVQGNYCGTQRPQGLKGATPGAGRNRQLRCLGGGKPPCASAKVSEPVSVPRDLSMEQTRGKLIPERIEIKIGEAGAAQW